VSADAETLAELARNRGLKLVRSRIRTPGKRGFGKFGLADGNGAPVLGLDGKRPSASADEVEAFLRKEVVGDWAASLGVAPPRRKKRKASPAPPPPPKTEVRDATAADASALAALIALLGHQPTPAAIRKHIKAARVPDLVAVIGKQVVGLCGRDLEQHIHRERPVGRMTILIVAEPHRGEGIGRMLVEAALARFADEGCGMVEVTSNKRLAKAHRFYRHIGFDETSLRFVRKL